MSGVLKPGASNTAAATHQDGIGFDQLLNVLNVEPHEHVSIFYKLDDESKHAAVVRAVDAVRYVENELPDAANTYFGVCPVAGPPRRGVRGTEGDVTRLSALWADLDLKS